MPHAPARALLFGPKLLHRLLLAAAGLLGWMPLSGQILCRNETPGPVWAAWCYWDAGSESWVSQGWKYVDPGETLALHPGPLPAGGQVYLHARDTSGHEWGRGPIFMVHPFAPFEIADPGSAREPYAGAEFTEIPVLPNGEALMVIRAREARKVPDWVMRSRGLRVRGNE
ncbi:MAG: DUF1036 domain-containing protein [Bacteroidia bacterium]|nr:DUF1036 domain-containing protein [Bacteroidia bacterium]